MHNCTILKNNTCISSNALLISNCLKLNITDLHWCISNFERTNIQIWSRMGYKKKRLFKFTGIILLFLIFEHWTSNLSLILMLQSFVAIPCIISPKWTLQIQLLLSRFYHIILLLNYINWNIRIAFNLSFISQDYTS